MPKTTKSPKICIIMGTRPEIIKMSSIIQHCETNKLNYFVINTSQHYDYNMSMVFFKELKLPTPKYKVQEKKGTHAQETARMLVQIEEILLKERPDVVLVEGDTNTVLAGALAARKLHIKVGHVEAGLRSFDERMPEEMNRILTDHASTYLFAPTSLSKENLLKEGIPSKKIFVTGNTVVDAIYNFKKYLTSPKKLEKQIGFSLKKNEYMLATIHRPENVDDQATLKDVLNAFKQIYTKYSLPIVYPIHPRTRKMIKKFNLTLPKGMFIADPVSYFELLYLVTQSRLVVTDSGGVQEEACILKVPCVTVRISTERPETVSAGSNLIAGTSPKKVVSCVSKMMKALRTWKNPFGNGKTGERILSILLKDFK